MTEFVQIALQAVNAPAIGVVLEAPPVLMASEHSVEYIRLCCATILLHADELLKFTGS